MTEAGNDLIGRDQGFFCQVRRENREKKQRGDDEKSGFDHDLFVKNQDLTFKKPRITRMIMKIMRFYV